MPNTMTDHAAVAVEVAGPLAAVQAALGGVPGNVFITPGVTHHALLLAAEALTARVDSCTVCATWPGLCGPCAGMILWAVDCRLRAERVRREAVL